MTPTWPWSIWRSGSSLGGLPAFWDRLLTGIFWRDAHKPYGTEGSYFGTVATRHHIWCQMLKTDHFKAVVEALESQKTSMRCQDMVKALESLGFNMRDGRKQGHKVFFHQALSDFKSSSFTCGHGRNPEIKPVYIANIHKLLLRHEADIRLFLETRDGY